MSIVAPGLMVPPTIIIIIKLSKHLKYFKDELEKELKANKKKDILLFEQARFVLMGEMMANISHQWKQPLNTINLSIVNAKMSKEDDLQKYFDIVEDNVNYLSSTIDDFMSFFDKRTHTEIRSLEEIIKEIKSIAQIKIDNLGIELDIRLENMSENVQVVSSISQVILNLLSNATDAFSDEIERKKITLKFVSTEDALEIICCDNGKGVNFKVKEKIFDPYFTTKHKSQGTGIGLYMSKEIVQKVFGGSIKLSPVPTCFYVNIPYSDKCILQKRQK